MNLLATRVFNRLHRVWHRWNAFRRQRAAADSPPRLVDAFLLFNEIDLLEIRLRELDAVVDRFVIVEADRSFAGRPKPFFFEKWRDRFEKWQHKIVYAPLRMPDASSPDDEEARARNEYFQREHIGRVVAGLGLRGDDIVVASDVDEIWRARCAADIAAGLFNAAYCVLVLRNFRGYINNVGTTALNGAAWAGPVACRAATFLANGPSHIRLSRASAGTVHGERMPHCCYVHDAGWHFSSLGGPDAFWIKAQNFSHMTDPHRIIDVPAETQAIRVLTGPLSREECAASQRLYLANAADTAFAPLRYDEFSIAQDVPAGLKADKEKYRRYFFFTDCV